MNAVQYIETETLQQNRRKNNFSYHTKMQYNAGELNKTI